MMIEEVLFSIEGQVGVITLNRPNALNALTFAMIIAMHKQLEQWKQDDKIQAVLICATPSNAFCAGGDIRWLYQTGKAQTAEAMQFFWHEYRLNHLIHEFGKPYIALMDGMTMGGGVGVSLHGSHPVASERFVFAMPETSIGFFPDIGASHLLNRCPGHLGVYLGLTGNRFSPEESKQAGLVRFIVSSDQFAALFETLTHADLKGNAKASVDECIQSFVRSDSIHEPIAHSLLIEQYFSKPTVSEIRSSLAAGEEWAKGVDSTLAKKSPLSLQVTLAQLHKTRGLSLAECLKIDYTLVNHFMNDHDFYEGVRALLIDKDKNPQWSPATAESVSDSQVMHYFEQQGMGLKL
jgi:enoyl-CoA hydratase/carnithine racemase